MMILGCARCVESATAGFSAGYISTTAPRRANSRVSSETGPCRLMILSCPFPEVGGSIAQTQGRPAPIRSSRLERGGIRQPVMPVRRLTSAVGLLLQKPVLKGQLPNQTLPTHESGFPTPLPGWPRSQTAPDRIAAASGTITRWKSVTDGKAGRHRCPPTITAQLPGASTHR